MSKPARRRSPLLLFAALWIALLPAGVPIAAVVEPISETPHPLWISDGALTPQARGLLGVLRHVEDFGLSAGDFAPLLATIDASLEPFDDGRLEQTMTLGALRLMRQLHDGRVDARSAGYALRRGRTPVDFTTMLKALAASRDVSATLASLEPGSSQYHALERALARYRRLSDVFVPLPAPHSIRPGDAYAGAADLRRRLEELGDATPLPGEQAAASGIYDQALAEAVIRFQTRHGLQADGVLGSRTASALAVPMSVRIQQIELTMERWRWLPDLRAPAVIVNVPQFMLYTLSPPDVSGGPVQLRRISVIVGKLENQTPLFDSAIEAVIFRPWWDVPRDITRLELLPLIERDPGYLDRHEMEIVRGAAETATVLPPDPDAIAALRAGRARLRQRPGPNNALGLIKFVLPNPYAVYLHSTPEESLFGRDRRALSHGCIRVSEPAELAAYLLKDTPGNWTPDAIEAATCASETLKVSLARPVPVYILYGTAVADGDQVLFFDDIYGYDRKLAQLLTDADRAIAAQRAAR
jgi:murein L,D-transpeptidase YcbB/YkuD